MLGKAITRRRRARLTKRRWLELAVAALRPRYRRASAPLPRRIELHVTNLGPNDCNGLWVGPPYTDPPHQVLIDAHLRAPRRVLAVLIHELCHAARPDLRENAPEFTALLARMGGIGAPPPPGATRALARLAHKLGPWPVSRTPQEKAGKRGPAT